MGSSLIELVRYVLDTNVVASALLWGGLPQQLLQAARLKHIAIYTSIPMLDELIGILSRPKFSAKIAAAQLPIEQIVLSYAQLASVVRPHSLPRTAPDPDDDVVIGTALAAQARWLVTGDKALLGLRQYQNIELITVAQAVPMIDHSQQTQ